MDTVLISNNVGVVCDTKGPIRLLYHFALLHQVCKDIGSTLIIECIRFSLSKLHLEILDLVFLLFFNGLRQRNVLQLFLHVSLCSTTLASSLEQMSAGSVRRYISLE